VLVTHEIFQISDGAVGFKDLFCNWTSLILFLSQHLKDVLLSPALKSPSQIVASEIEDNLLSLMSSVLFSFGYLSVSSKVYPETTQIGLSKQTCDILFGLALLSCVNQFLRNGIRLHCFKSLHIRLVPEQLFKI